ncbi:hypothetical protein [Absidia glauca]|uniref:F-box domain-containing protein n=1 Tax=Absidia glauca TaxID=4829 RepID=A0A163KFH8_ABSGL|nr:hypothetical protein [Absidia glauca]
MPSSSYLPLELIRLVLSFLPHHDILHLLLHPPNHDWLYATASVVYRRLVLTQIHQVKSCAHLLEQTHKRRRLGDDGFYSTINYALFIRRIDLSALADKSDLTDGLLLSLALDAVHLTHLNLYNCFTVTNPVLTKILIHCPHLEKLSLAGATSLNVSCFLDHRIDCLRLHTLNLNMSPHFFTNTRRRRRRRRLPPFPKLQELKLDMIALIINDYGSSLVAMLDRCANVIRLSLTSLYATQLQRCFDHCPNVNAITFRRCHFDEGMLASFLSQRRRQLERLELRGCRVDIQELAVGDYRRLQWFGCREKVVPGDLIPAVSSLTRIECPMTDDVLERLMTHCPSLTHLSYTGKVAHEILARALLVWQKTLVWLEMEGDWINGCLGNHIQVLLLHRMKVTADGLIQLARCFTKTRYLAFEAADDVTSQTLEHALDIWPCLEGALCVNQEALMVANKETWLDWKWLDTRKTRFTRWKDKDLIE